MFSYGLIITSPGLHIIGTRAASQESTDDKTIITQITSLRIVLSLIAIVIIAIGSWWFVNDMAIRLTIVLYSLSLIPFAFQIAWYFQGKQRVSVIGMCQSLSLLIFVLIVIFSVKSPEDVLIVPIAFFINTTVNSALLFVTFFKKEKSTTKISSVFEAVKGWKGLLRQSLPVGAASIAGQFILYFPIILLGAFGATSDIGNFSAASRLIFFLLVVDRAIYVLFYPLVSHTFAADPSRLGNQVHRILGYLLLASLPICVGGYVLSRPLISFIFGPQYEDSSPFFQILLFYFLFTVLNSIFAYVVIAVGKERRYSTIIVSVSSLVIVSMLPLTYYWKGIGGAWGMAGGELLMMALMYRECSKSISPRLADALKKPLVCSLLMGAILFSFPHIGLALSLALGIVSYFLCIILLKGITKEDLIFLRERLI